MPAKGGPRDVGGRRRSLHTVIANYKLCMSRKYMYHAGRHESVWGLEAPRWVVAGVHSGVSHAQPGRFATIRCARFRGAPRCDATEVRRLPAGQYGPGWGSQRQRTVDGPARCDGGCREQAKGFRSAGAGAGAGVNSPVPVPVPVLVPVVMQLSERWSMIVRLVKVSNCKSHHVGGICGQRETLHDLMPVPGAWVSLFSALAPAPRVCLN